MSRQISIAGDGVNAMVLGMLENMRMRWRTLRVWARAPDARLEPGVIVKGRACDVVLGRGVVIQSGTVLHAGGKEWCLGTGRIEIGDGSVISPNCVLYGAGPGGLRIGRRFDCGPLVGIYASHTEYGGHATHVFAPVVIGDDVVVFSHAVISPGVTIGDGAVIAAGAVVLDDVPAGAFVAGVPARIVRQAPMP